MKTIKVEVDDRRNAPMNFKGRHDSEVVDTGINVGTIRRLLAIAENNNNLDTENMTIDTLINVALDWQKKMYDKTHDELNKFMRKVIKGE